MAGNAGNSEPTNYLRPNPLLGQSKGGGGQNFEPAPGFGTQGGPQIASQANARTMPGVNAPAPLGNYAPTMPVQGGNPRVVPAGMAPPSITNNTSAYPNTPNMSPWGNNYIGPTDLTPGGASGGPRPEMGAAFYRNAAAHPGNVGAQYWIDRAGQAYENPLPHLPGQQDSISTDAYGNQRFDYNQGGANFGNATGQYNPGDLTHPGGLSPNPVARTPAPNSISQFQRSGTPGVTPGNQQPTFRPTEGRTLLQTGTPGVTPRNLGIRGTTTVRS
jgi:hypothetical protein